MSKLSKVFAILTIVSSVIGIVIIVFNFPTASGDSKLIVLWLIVLCFGLTLTVIPYCIARSISELNNLSNLKFLHSEVVDED